MPPPPEAPADSAEPQAPLDSALDDLIGYAMRRAQLKLFQNLIGRLSAHDLRPAQFFGPGDHRPEPRADAGRSGQGLDHRATASGATAEQTGKPGIGGAGALQTGQALLWDFFLSKTGEALLKELKLIAAESDMDATSNLDSQEREELLRLLKKVYQA